MNKRLEELAEQADLYARSDNSSMLLENFQKRYTEKFAKLILQDVLAICEEKGDQGLDGHYCADEIAKLYKD